MEQSPRAFKTGGLFEQVRRVVKKNSPLLIFFAATNIAALFFGEWAVARGVPYVLELREKALREIPELFYIKPLTGVLAPYLSLKILYTFLFNLIFGAFLSTTLTGVVFFVPYLITLWRGFLVGALFYGMDGGPLHALVFYGTFLLEFGGYCVSSVAGTKMGLALLRPVFDKNTTIGESFSRAAREGALLYLVVIALLFAGAFWEMGWLHYIGGLPGP